MDKRNIRNSYYNQLGVTQQKLKTSLDELFKRRIIEFEGIKTICKEFTLTSQYRALIWRIVLLNDKFKVKRKTNNKKVKDAKEKKK